MGAGAIANILKIGPTVLKPVAKKVKKVKKTKKERALEAAEAEARYEQGLGLFEVPLAGLKKGGMVIKDKQYLKGK